MPASTRITDQPSRTTILGGETEPAPPRRGRRDDLARHGARARLLLRADRRGPGPLAADLLRPRAARADVVRLLRLGGVEGAQIPADAERAGGPRELRRDPPGRDLRRDDAAHRLDLGAHLVGRLVDVGR